MANQKVRDALTQYNVRQWQLANLCNISEFTMCKRMREELPEQEQKRLIKLIRESAKG